MSMSHEPHKLGKPDSPGSKIAIVGTGLVGATAAYALLIKGLATDLVLVDANRDKAEGEAMDLGHGLPFVSPAGVRVGDYRDCAGADVVIIAAGANQKPGETRLDLAHKNASIMKDVISGITRHGSPGVILVITNPVDVLTFAALKYSGYPPARVIGSGTVLDTARFRYLLSRHCEVNPRNVHAYIIGEHGDSEVPVWSLANVAGVRLEDLCPVCGPGCDPEFKMELSRQAREAAYDVIDRKGATYYAIGLGIAAIVQSIIRDELSVMTVSTLVQGYHGVSDICLSVPTILGSGGIHNTIDIPLSPEEERAFFRSGEVLKEVARSLGL